MKRTVAFLDVLGFRELVAHTPPDELGPRYASAIATVLQHLNKPFLPDQDRLVAGGADVNAVEKDAMTPLMIAAFHGHLDVVKALARAGADVTRTDGDGSTALRNAQARGHTDIVGFLKGLSEPAQVPVFSSAAGDLPVGEASMNFDIGDVNSFLESVSRRIEKGFSVGVARDLATRIALLALDDEGISV